MIVDAREDKYDGVIKIRSFLNEQPAPVATDFECAPGLFSVTVTLIGSFAKATTPVVASKP